MVNQNMKIDYQCLPCKYCGNKHPTKEEKCPVLKQFWKIKPLYQNTMREKQISKHDQEVYTDTVDSKDSTSDEFVFFFCTVNEVASRRITVLMNIKRNNLWNSNLTTDQLSNSAKPHIFEIVVGKHLHVILGILTIQAMDLIIVNHNARNSCPKMIDRLDSMFSCKTERIFF